MFVQFINEEREKNSKQIHLTHTQEEIKVKIYLMGLNAKVWTQALLTKKFSRCVQS